MACVLACTGEFVAKTNSLVSSVSPLQTLDCTGGGGGDEGGGGGRVGEDGEQMLASVLNAQRSCNVASLQLYATPSLSASSIHTKSAQLFLNRVSMRGRSNHSQRTSLYLLGWSGESSA